MEPTAEAPELEATKHGRFECPECGTQGPAPIPCPKCSEATQ